MQFPNRLLYEHLIRQRVAMQTRLLTEEQHVSNLVHQATAGITNSLCNYVIEKCAKQLSNAHSIIQQTGMMTIFGKRITVAFKLHHFADYKTYQHYARSGELPRTTASYNQSTDTIEIVFMHIGNDFVLHQLYTSLGHELEHLYQGVKKNGRLLDNSRTALYDKTIDLLLNNETDSEGSGLARIVYFTFNEERAAYLQSIYEYIMCECNHPSLVKIKYKQSEGYRTYKIICDDLDRLKAMNGTNHRLATTLVQKYYPTKTPEWFVNNGEKALSSFLSNLGSILMKAQHDISERVKQQCGMT